MCTIVVKEDGGTKVRLERKVGLRLLLKREIDRMVIVYG